MKKALKVISLILVVAIIVTLFAGCVSGSGSSSSTVSSKSTSSSSSSSSAGGAGKCKYKVGGTYVCSKTATNGNYCKEHYNYLMNAYNSLTGG